MRYEDLIARLLISLGMLYPVVMRSSNPDSFLRWVCETLWIGEYGACEYEEVGGSPVSGNFIGLGETGMTFAVALFFSLISRNYRYRDAAAARGA